VFKETYPEYVKNNKILYPIKDSLLKDKPDIHNYIPIPKPSPDIIPSKEQDDLLEIWSFCMTFNKALKIAKFSLIELYQSLCANTKDDSLLVTQLLQSFIEEFIEDVKAFNDKELYSTFAIFLLEISDYVYMCPMEAVGLIFKVKKYRRCISMPALNNILSMIEQYESQQTETIMPNFTFRQKKELLLALVRGLCVVDTIRENSAKQVQEHKKYKQEEKHRAHLEKNIKSTKEELSSDKKRELLAKQRELNKLEANLKKKKVVTEKLGVDADDSEYWTFAGDNAHLYVKSNKGWGYYSTKEQLDKLLESLSDKGILERKLKNTILTRLKQFTITEDIENKILPYSDRLRGSKKKYYEKRELRMIDTKSLIECVLEIENGYKVFFEERNIVWEEESIRSQWLLEAKELKDSVNTKKWMLKFALSSMQPFFSTNLPKAIKSAIRMNQEFDFNINDEETKSKVSLRGIIWKELGETVYSKWLEYIESSQNTNELFLAVKLLHKRLELLYNTITTEETKKSKATTSVKPLPNLRPRTKVSLKEWNNECYICGEGGEVLCCDTCPNVVHLECVGLKETPEGIWQCESCSNKVLTTRQTRSIAKKLQRISETYS